MHKAIRLFYLFNDDLTRTLSNLKLKKKSSLEIYAIEQYLQLNCVRKNDGFSREGAGRVNVDEICSSTYEI